MGSHSISCHPTQANSPRLNPSRWRLVLIYRPRRDGRLSWPRCLITRGRGIYEPLLIESENDHLLTYCMWGVRLVRTIAISIISSRLTTVIDWLLGAGAMSSTFYLLSLFVQFQVHVPRWWTLWSGNTAVDSRSVPGSMPWSLVANW